MRSRFCALVGAALLACSGVALARSSDSGEHDHGAHAEHDEHGAHGEHHVPTFDDINWYYGMLMEREGVEPSLLFRPKGMPVPYLGYVVNALGLYALLYFAARKSVRDGLARRKANIERGMREAAELKAQAERQLAEYERKLANIEQEIERVRREMRHAGDLERARILDEARARRERMERDAKLLVEQELAAAREQLLRETVRSAVRSANEALRSRVTPDDHARLAEEYLGRLSQVGSSLRSPS